MKNLPISRWAAEDCPTYKAENSGLQGLSNAELLSIIVGCGTSDSNAIELSRTILSDNDNYFKSIAKKPLGVLNKYKGIGMKKAVRILAAIEIGRRMLQEDSKELVKVSTAYGVHKLMKPLIGNLDIEEFWVLYMNNAQKVIKPFKLSVGGLTETAVDVRIIIKEAVLCNSTVMILAHNHPSGNARPSKYDDNVTEVVKKACDMMRIKFIDHVIVTENDWYSYQEYGRL